MRLVRPRTIPPLGTPQLAAGERAGPGLVGYLGDTADLSVLNNGSSTPSGWSASWDAGTLIVAGNSVTIDHYRINGSVVFTGSNPTMTNCTVFPNANDIFGITLSGTNKGYLTVTDTTVTGNSSGANPQVNAISSDSGLIAIRCDVFNTGDGIHHVAQPGTASKISQCYIHDQAFLNEEQHCDGIQGFNHATSAASYIIEHTYVGITRSTIGTIMNAASTAGPPTNNTEPLVTGTYNNNYFGGGIYHLRINFRHQNTVVTNNSLGTKAADEVALIAVDEPASIGSWSNNRDAANNLIPQP